VNRRKNLINQVIHGIDVDTVPMPKVPLVEITGCRRVLIENHFGVIGYSTNEICVRVRKGSIIIHGTQLLLTKMSKEQIVVTGCIDGVRLAER